MAKWVILIGNGLGLSLDDDFFSLAKGMKEAWDKLTKQEQSLIKTLLGKIPQNEDDLLSLQYFNKAIYSSKDRSRILKIGELCLSSLSCIIEKFRKNVAGSYICHPSRGFFENKHFQNFADQLAQFILKHGDKDRWDNICLATVNYDNLLYSYYLFKKYPCPLDSSSKNIIGGDTEGVFQDGFCKKDGRIIFDPYCLYHLRKRQGFYLHLHGSIKYHSTDGQIQKIRHEDINGLEITTKDIVLANSEEKLDAINGSQLLRHYWNIFEDHIFKCDTMIILGCGGKDNHINNIIKKRIDIRKTAPNIIIGIRKNNSADEIQIWNDIFKNYITIEKLITPFEEGDKNVLKHVQDPAVQSKNIFAIMDDTLAFQWSD